MNRRLARACYGLAIVFLFGVPGAAAPPTAAELNALVKQLGDSKLAVRVAATQKLLAVGDTARSALEEATKSGDLEIAYRARYVLDQIQHGAGPGTPPEVITAMEQFRFGDANAKRAAFDTLVKHGQIARLRKLIDEQTDVALREELSRRLLAQIEQAITLLIVNNKLDEAQQEVEAAVPRGATLHLATMLHIRGQAAARIESLQQKLPLDPASADGQLLRALLRLDGRHADARQLAEKAGDRDSLVTALYDTHDWAGLAELQARTQPGGNSSPIVRIRHYAALAVFHEAAGQSEAAAAARAKVRELAEQASNDNDSAIDAAAQSLKVAGWTAAALDVLKGRRRHEAADTLRYQGRFAEAFEALALSNPRENAVKWFDALDPNDTTSPIQRPSHPVQLGMLAARLLFLLGETDESLRLFEAIGQIKPTPKVEQDVMLALAKVEADSGVDEPTLRHLARYLELAPNAVLPPLFTRQAGAEQAWLKILGAINDPQSSNVDRVRQTRALVDPRWRKQLDAAAWKSLVAAVDKVAESESNAALRAQNYFAPLAEAALLRGDRDTAYKYWQAAATLGLASAHLKLGDLRYEDQAWEQAAEHYKRAWQADANQVIARYLQGLCEIKTGAEQTGRAAIEQARLCPLADVNRRQTLAQGLKTRGLTAEAAREWEMITHLTTTNDLAYFTAGQEVAVTLNGRDDLRAAHLWRRLAARIVAGSVNVERDGSLRIMHNALKLQASHLLKSNQAEQAVASLRQAQDILPGETQLVVEFVERLEKADRKTDADALFDRAYNLLEKGCGDYSRAALLHNNLAWMAAKSRRRLDDALAHARRAVELSPENAGYLDTLAEVYYQRGELAEAVRTAQRCLELTPNNAAFKKQLERFQAAQKK